MIINTLTRKIKLKEDLLNTPKNSENDNFFPHINLYPPIKQKKNSRHFLPREILDNVPRSQFAPLLAGFLFNTTYSHPKKYSFIICFSH